MAAIDDLIAQIEDKALRARLKEEADRLRREKKFGLVFEEHLPELTPVYAAEVRPGCLAAKRGTALTDIWRVLAVEEGQAHCLNRASGVHEVLPAAALVAVLEFGDPIFPSLVPLDRVQNGPDDASWHTLIEADNYHALQLLEYLYAGQVDCIYIDPPYNTGARDWKYNNDYVDRNDGWRHSKWLSFMSKRIHLAEKLLGPDAVLIVTIDEHEVHHLGILLQQTLRRVREIQMVTIVTNTAGSLSPGKFSRAEEYAFFCFFGDAKPVPMVTDMLSDAQPVMQFWFPLFRSRGLNDRPSKRPNLVYPVAVDPETLTIIGTGRSLKERFDAGEVTGDLDAWKPDLTETIDGNPVVWPILNTQDVTTWQVSAPTLRELASAGFVRVRRSKNSTSPRAFAISYIKTGNRKKILDGEVVVAGREPGGAYILRSGIRTTIPKSTWRVPSHDARLYGTTMLRALVGQTSFTYPKSPYATADTLLTVVAEKKNALVVDFFAGSGTTLHSVVMLNNLDGGNRRCVLVTNNEVSDDETKALTDNGYRVGDPEWEQRGVCQSVTWPRSKNAIRGRRDDGTELVGEYLTGGTITKEKPRAVRQLSFIDPAALTTTARKRELVSLIGTIPAGEITGDAAWFVSAEARCTAAILFDAAQGDAFLEALEGLDHITHFYIVTQNNRRFVELKAQIEDLLGPIEVQEEEKRPMRDGFPANLEYFKLDFLDKNHVALGRQFREILPLLWLRAGAVGARPELPAGAPIPAMLIPAANPFAVLVDETRFADFLAAISGRSDLTHLFLITDSEDAFREMAVQLAAPHVIQLYRNYLENFMINRGETA